jgi:hypothetical protein
MKAGWRGEGGSGTTIRRQNSATKMEANDVRKTIMRWGRTLILSHNRSRDKMTLPKMPSSVPARDPPSDVPLRCRAHAKAEEFVS